MSTARSKAHRLGEMQLEGCAETDGSLAKAIIHVGGKHVPGWGNVVSSLQSKNPHDSLAMTSHVAARVAARIREDANLASAAERNLWDQNKQSASWKIMIIRK
jgi:hypothetical protein